MLKASAELFMFICVSLTPGDFLFLSITPASCWRAARSFGSDFFLFRFPIPFAMEGVYKEVVVKGLTIKIHLFECWKSFRDLERDQDFHKGASCNSVRSGCVHVY